MLQYFGLYSVPFREIFHFEHCSSPLRVDVINGWPLIDCLEIIVSTLYILVLLNLMLRDTILKAAKILVDNAKKLVVGAGSGQEELASAAKESVNTINRLTEFMKRGAASLGSSQPEAQVKYLVEAIILLTVFVL